MKKKHNRTFAAIDTDGVVWGTGSTTRGALQSARFWGNTEVEIVTVDAEKMASILSGKNWI